ncbi:hypothetical protein OMP40_32215 [Cohnella rhizosphaerae]|uniref:Uncharacterized protein n=1 Tax=Cohnella rhizosphaerae TaxID=1457232 RepID=A0A9X4QVK4_9BACL|nr:hypothetical protein [Cohnella rhizosphaerae]MDG0813431.1 hypothetical protein [Cohnella rhizosphaerae]
MSFFGRLDQLRPAARRLGDARFGEQILVVEKRGGHVVSVDVVALAVGRLRLAHDGGVHRFAPGGFAGNIRVRLAEIGSQVLRDAFGEGVVQFGPLTPKYVEQLAGSGFDPHRLRVVLEFFVDEFDLDAGMRGFVFARDFLQRRLLLQSGDIFRVGRIHLGVHRDRALPAVRSAGSAAGRAASRAASCAAGCRSRRSGLPVFGVVAAASAKHETQRDQGRGAFGEFVRYHGHPPSRSLFLKACSFLSSS